MPELSKGRSAWSSLKEGYEKEIESLKKQIAELKNQIPAAQRSGTVGGNIQDQWTKTQDRMGSLQENAASVVTSPFASFDSSLDKALTTMMEKGTSFRQFWNSIAIGMGQDFLQSVSKMASDEATSLAMRAVQWVAHTALQVATHTAGEQAQTAATTGGAMERDLIRVGETLFHAGQVALRTAAHIGGEILQTTITVGQAAIRIAVILAETIPYLIKAAIMAMDAMADIPYVGPALAIAAAGAIIAAGAGLMSRDDGGPGEPGQVYHIGRGAQDEIFVPHTAGTFFAKNQWSYADAKSPASGGDGSGAKPVNLHFYDSRPHPRDYLNSSEGENHVVNITSKNRLKIGIQT